MNRWPHSIALLMLLTAAPLCAQPPGSDAPGIWEQRVATVGDIPRIYYLYKPLNYQLYPDRPLIVNLHGSIEVAQLDSVGQRPEVFMFGQQFTPNYLDTTRASMMWKVAEAHKVLVACPLSRSTPAWSPDDVTNNLIYLEAMLNDLEANYGDYIDSDRIYATGFSSGGGQVHRVGYQGSDRVAAIAPMYFPINTDLYPLGPPAVGPLGILFVANRWDPTPDVPYTEPSDTVTILQTAQRWNQWLGMSFSGGFFHTGPIDTVMQMRFRHQPASGERYHIMQFYTLFESEGQFRHSYPKYDEHGFQANTEIWDFVRQFHLPPGQSREAALDAHRVIRPAPLDPEVVRVYPNPFNSAATVSLTLPQAGVVELTMLDILGRRVMTLSVPQPFAAGLYRFTIDGSDLSSGAYFVNAVVDGHAPQIQKLVLTK